MKRLPKCLLCKQIAEENYRIHGLSKGYMYKLLREQCTHTVEQQKGCTLQQDALEK